MNKENLKKVVNYNLGNKYINKHMKPKIRGIRNIKCYNFSGYFHL